jgi:dGTPase
VVTLLDRLQRANTLLAPYAAPHEGILGRVYEEPPDETRFPFQRDCDRIIHTQAFRRLKGKTQVFVAGTHGSPELTTSDHIRTRLTHTMEVAQISRDIARALRLNEDLTEAIALAHDLGHPPFGHAGEAALDAWMHAHGGRFEHNEQSHRVVTLLAEHSTHFPGLNLNQEVLEGLLKYTTPHDGGSSPMPCGMSLEGQIVNVADEIAYTGHDCEDGMRGELFTMDDLLRIPLAHLAEKRAQPRGTSLRGALIHVLVVDLLMHTQRLISDYAVRTGDDVAACTVPLARFSPATEGKLRELRDFLWQRMYLHPDVLDRSREGQRVIQNLCDRYVHEPPPKVLDIQHRTASALPEAVKDYVAGMTDSYAVQCLRGSEA